MSRPNPQLLAARAIIKALEAAIIERHSGATIRFEQNSKLADYAKSQGIENNYWGRTVFERRAESAQETVLFCKELMDIIHHPEEE